MVAIRSSISILRLRGVMTLNPELSPHIFVVPTCCTVVMVWLMQVPSVLYITTYSVYQAFQAQSWGIMTGGR